ncbi:unnamed protein product [Rotaria sp. Silwood2]|nr:unnamed protein product [Rotaria sp. Silwood2]CAF2831815.1 unnamed protein product [Rotaria sp. Silwood2]CAF3137052.1 unnamed protein product [Rotaria sp. Silwood2]CAF3860474.1 unnamed protein product [Rotaria sp. Silwood2]CAF4036663.1 unnamed protein product [Rotaria sp. Silwood2]
MILWKFNLAHRLSIITKTTSYQVIFKQESRSDSDFWKIVKENGIVDGENLPTPVVDSNGDIMCDEKDDFNDCTDAIDNDIIQLVQQLSDDTVANLLVDISSSHSLSDEPSQTKHDLARKVATDHYLNVANKKMKHYQNSIINEIQKFYWNDCVDVKINTVNRTNTNAKLLPCLIVDRIEKNEKITSKRACLFSELGKFIFG